MSSRTLTVSHALKLLLMILWVSFDNVSSAAPPGYSKCDGSEWKYYSSKMNWVEAEEHCVRDGGHLATLRTDRERKCFVEAASSSSDIVWIGVNDRKEEGDFRWASNEELNEPVDSRRWLYAQPNGNTDGHGDQDCGYTAVKLEGRFGDDECELEHSFVCQIEPEATECHGEKWTFHTERVNWHEANQSCREHGGYLATVNDQADRQCIRIAVSSFDSGLLWVGLTDIKEEGVYVWDSDQHVEPANGPHWIKGQPGNLNPEEQDCVYSRKSDGRLGDDPCSTTLPYICELKLGGEGGEESEEEEGEEEEEEEFPEWGIAVIALSFFISILAAIFFWQKRRLRREQEEEEKSKDVEAQTTKVHYDGRENAQSDRW